MVFRISKIHTNADFTFSNNIDTNDKYFPLDIKPHFHYTITTMQPGR